MNEKAISLVAAEWEALAGLPYMQRAIYWVLRWYMSVATRRVGDVRGISLQSLAEELYVDPAPGRSESGAPTKKAVRSALLQLEKHGLIEPCGNGEVLVFLLPKAGTAQAREKTKGHKRGTVSGHAIGHGETTQSQGFSPEMGHAMGHPKNPLKGHTSEVVVNPIYEEAYAAAQPPTVERLLSTGSVLSLPLTSAQIAEWLRQHEHRRGKRTKVINQALQITDWIAKGITPEELAEAYCLAVIDREVTKNPSPINLGFLDIFIKRVLDGREVSRSGGAQSLERWPYSWDGLNRKAEELGIPLWDRDRNEGFEEYQRRVLLANRRLVEARGEVHA